MRENKKKEEYKMAKKKVEKLLYHHCPIEAISSRLDEGNQKPNHSFHLVKNLYRV